MGGEEGGANGEAEIAKMRQEGRGGEEGGVNGEAETEAETVKMREGGRGGGGERSSWRGRNC